MNILLVGGNYLASAIKKRGHNALCAGHLGSQDIALNHPVTIAKLVEKLGDFQPDLLCYIDDGNLPLLIDPQAAPWPSIYYSIDTYCNPWHAGYARGFDLALVAQKDFLPLFENMEARWFPLFCFMDNIDSAPGEAFADRDIPVAFVGSLGHKNNPGREPFLRNFQKLHPLFLYKGDYRPIFGRGKIVLNQTAFSEINFRCFEAMGSGCALLSENCANGFSELFAPGENILPPYQRGDFAQAAATAREWLAKPEDLAAVAAAGKEYAIKSHSDAARAEELERIAVELRERGPRETAALAEERLPYVRSAFGMLAAELDRPEMAMHRDFFYCLAAGKALGRRGVSPPCPAPKEDS